MYSPVEDNLEDKDVFLAFNSLISLFSVLVVVPFADMDFFDFLLRLFDLSAVEDEAVESLRFAESSLFLVCEGDAVNAAAASAF